MSEQQRDESGHFAEKVSEQDILTVFDRADAPFLTSGEVADELSISREAVNHRLNRMHENGLVGRKEVGARAVGWWATATDAVRERDYLKSFGKYADTNIAETAEAVSERFDRDLRERHAQRTSGEE